MDTSHCRRRGFILLLVLFHSSVLGLASNMDVSDDARGIKIHSNQRRSLFNSIKLEDHIVCTNQKPDPGPVTRISCAKPRYIMTKITFAEYGNPTGKCGQFIHGNCSAQDTLRIAKKTCLGRTTCVLMVTDKMFGPSHCKGVPMFAVTTRAPMLAVQAACSYFPP